MKIGFSSALCLVFITLKLTDQITWSWWLVISPILIDFIISVIFGVHRARKKKEIEKNLEEYRNRHPNRRSKFMDKLDEAMKASENRNQKHEI